MNLSTLYRPFETAGAWPRGKHHAGEGDRVMPRLDPRQRHLLWLHLDEANPARGSDAPPRWPRIAIFCSLAFALFVVAASG